MEKEKKIEEMCKVMCRGCTKAECTPNTGCVVWDKAERAICAGYGNVKQAVKEFAEKLKELCDKKRKFYQRLLDECNSHQATMVTQYIALRNEWGEIKQTTDTLITELYGADK